ncbi:MULTISPECIES: EsaB/YukD family protein [Virgibacillus]|uniref:Ubiquitin-like domain-containing protein n=2 Tax=Virgibacillus TaxID=84406 RepID=A0ABQ2DVJ4_9BACI|nr:MULTISPECIES: EsaB/YukD family protein [Virgibacillus]EQB36688.1 hypothetical protein M948_16785 [Virgibacillus sp. CM-4]MYL42514.1 hypothetical protein [Virgibacillus massiliensis]GGJ74577.1 hypothetical protein GCM10007111_40120 [Virgibacillus kapii]CDQ40396.1 putative small protein [Virgibacillus massiliensis]
MAQNTHINVTFDFSKRFEEGKRYDLRIPIQLSVKQLLINVIATLGLADDGDSRFAIKVITKHLLIADDDYLIDYPVTDGDIFVVL